MKKDIHPDNYRLVVFKDTSCDYAFLTKSTVETKETIKWDDGKEYPLCKIEISNKSHPFFTGKQNCGNHSFPHEPWHGQLEGFPGTREIR